MTTVIPYEEDELAWEDPFGETPLNHAPDGNMPTIDHRVEEDHVWGFQTNWFNMVGVKNRYIDDAWSASQQSHVPYWTPKLTAPAYYSDEKFKKMERQWEQRIGLELLKLRQAVEFRMEDRVQRRRHKHELQAYIQGVYDSQVEDSMADVYVTDHKKPEEKYITFSEEEDRHFYKYSQELKSYKPAESGVAPQYKREKFERGSMKQKIFDPMAGAHRDANGSMVLNIEDKEIELMYEEINREQFARANTKAGFTDDNAIDEKVKLLAELNPESTNLWADILDRELTIFADGKKYDFVDDLQDAFQEGLRTPLATKIFNTIPDHVFWDIKKPLKAQEHWHLNPRNPARQVAGSDFFDLRATDQWMYDRETKMNIAPGVSRHRNY